MWLSGPQLAAALYASRDLISRRILGGQPIPQGVKELNDDLVAASAQGTNNVAAEEQSIPDDLIDTNGAAVIVGCSARWIRHIAADLDGQRCGGRWIFRRATVAEYAEMKGPASESN